MLFKTKKEMQSLIDASRHSLIQAEKQVVERNKLITNQTQQLKIKYATLEEIIKLVESNDYDNAKVKLRKIKELAQTAIED